MFMQYWYVVCDIYHDLFMFITAIFVLCCVATANQEYYHQWNVEESHGCCLDLSTFTVEELDNITSEYTLQNTVRKQYIMLAVSNTPIS